MKISLRLKHTIALLLFIHCSLPYVKVMAQIQVDSVSTTISTCPNNGSISVYATSSNPPLLYSITAGPTIQAQQTSMEFNSLPPGNYTIKITDGIGNTSFQNATIIGNYKVLDFKPTTITPRCVGGHDGSISGNLTPGTGKGPFTWQLIAPSPVTSAPQSSDKFNNLPSGNYTVRLSDACGSFRTIVATVGVRANKMMFLTSPQTIKLGCDSMYIKVLVMNAHRVLPLRIKYETKNGVFITSTPTKLDTSRTKTDGYVYMEQYIANLDYGDFMKITVYNACGDSIIHTRNILPFTFYPRYSYNNCGTVITPSFLNRPDDNYLDGIRTPATYTFTEISTNTVVDQGTLTVMPSLSTISAITGFAIKPVEVGKTYQLTVTDGCGKIFQQNYTMPALAAPRITGRSVTSKACIDSVTGTYNVRTVGFSSNAKLILLSGPTKLGSTKPGYAYSDTYTYPDTISQGYGGNNFNIGNLAMGTYKFKIIDDCGHELFDQLIVYPETVTSLGRIVSYKKGCLGQNKIFYALTGGYAAGAAIITVTDLSNGVVLKKSEFSSYNPPSYKQDSVLNLPSGKFVVTFQFNTDPPYPIPHNDTNLPCTLVRDTITIEEYQTPEIYTSNAVMCNNQINMVLIPDSTKGVPPYSYEIVSGPETFPVQNNNVFVASKAGIYTARIFDVCGNASAKQIAIDEIALSFTPVSMLKNCNKVQYIYPASNYYTYTWTRPNKSTFVSDRLTIEPITPSDTGTYKVMKVININGCKDTIYASYHVSLSDITTIDSTICMGSVVIFGNRPYDKTGVYRDTLVSSTGCDSIIQLNLQVAAYKYSLTKKSFCPGETIIINGHSYTQPDTYSDTLATNTCDSIAVTELTFAPIPTVDLGKDTSFCSGKSMVLDAGEGQSDYHWSAVAANSSQHQITVTEQGEYWVVVTNQYGCKNSDTIEIGMPLPLPVANAGKDTSICAGETVLLTASGGTGYLWSPGGEQQAQIRVHPQTTTTYTVMVQDVYNCGIVADQVTVWVHPLPDKLPFQSKTYTHCFEEGAFTANAENGITFLWPKTGETVQSITVDGTDTYEVKVTNEYGCTISDFFHLKEYCVPKIFVPGAFSPNGDGLNDELEIFGSNVKNFKMMIFNRWGEVIFVSTNKNVRWNGFYRGEVMQIGSYPWTISYESEYEAEQKPIEIRGSVTLTR